MPGRLSIAAIVIAAACSQRAHIATCDDDLHGVWRAPSGTRWLMIDNGATLEAYPMEPDAPAGSDLIAAPRALDLMRGEHDLAGNIVRRYMRGAASCDSHVAVRVIACHDDALELVTADTLAPIAVAPCRWPVAPSRVERWARE